MTESEIYQLDNGMRVVYKHDSSIVAHLGVMMKAGSKYERENEYGLAHFLEHSFFKGTTHRKTFHVLSRLDSVGGELNAYTTKEEICVYGSFTDNHFVRAVELLSDILFNSVFPIKEIEKEKAVIIDEINSYLDSPSEKIFDDFEMYLYPNHPLGHNILGSVESVESFTKDDLHNYLERFLFPDNMVISFVGNLKLDFVLKQLNHFFGAFKKKSSLPKIGLPNDSKPFHIELAESNYQSHIMLGGKAPSYFDPDRTAFALITNVLGGPALNSRLVLGIREKYGYTYNIESSYNAFEETGYWNVYAGTDPKYQKKTIQLIEKEIALFMNEVFSDTQLKKVKEQIKGQLALSMDNNVNVMLNLAKNLLVYNQLDTLSDTYQKIDSISGKDIQRVSQIYFPKEKQSDLIFTVED
ncbi:MAG: insulinase family protein [Brumimicrobium sp.]|nr:insulinase family protein [Brumimicrobium sp.]